MSHLRAIKAPLYLLPSLVLHLVGMACFINWYDLWYNPPLHYTDYASHYARVAAVQYFLDGGQLWGYDPFFHAGFPNGTLFDMDNKAVELASWLLYHLGLPLPQAFNIVAVALIALAPLAVYPAGRMLGLVPSVAGLAQLMALMIWYGDPTVRWMWRGGVPTFAVAALGSMIVVSGFWRWAGRAGGAWWGSVLWFVVGPLLFWLHPGAFFTLVAPLAVGTLIAWRRWSWGTRLIPLVWSGWVIALNWPWLSVMLRFLATKAPSDQFMQGGLATLRDDFQASHTGLRLALFGLAALGLWRWRRAAELRWLPVAAGLGAGVLLAYAGMYVGLGDTQPYRFIMPALCWAVLPAASFVEQVWVRSPRDAVIWLLALSLVAGWPLYQARPRGLRHMDGTPADFLSGPQPAEQTLCAELGGLDLQSGRVLINDWRLGALLPTCSGAQVIGGPFLWVWTIYGYTNASQWEVLGVPVKQLDPGQLAEIFTRYNVRWVVVNTRLPPYEYTLADWAHDRPGLLVARSTHGPFTLYEVQQPADWFIRGTGEVEAHYNRLEVRQASPGGLLLKYHWIDSLRTDPPLPLHPVSLEPDPVPFIAVDNGQVTDFVIVQDYQVSEMGGR